MKDHVSSIGCERRGSSQLAFHGGQWAALFGECGIPDNARLSRAFLARAERQESMVGRTPGRSQPQPTES